MGGSINVESESGKGSKFSFAIAIKNDYKIERRSYRLPSRSLMQKSVLIVDGNTKSSAALAQMLKYFQFDVLEVAMPKETEELILDNTFDIIFIDMQMIDLYDLDALQKIYNGKIVVINQNKYLSHDLEKIRVDAYLNKPFNQQMIFNVIIKLFSKENIQTNHESDKITKEDLSVLSGCSVLLVEDNEINQTVIFGLLENTGIEITLANNGQIALETLEKMTDVDLILMDINMDVMDGYEASLHIRKNSRFDAVPIIALTADAMQKDVQKALEVGMQEHIGKPIDVQVFYALLLKYIEHRHAPINKPRIEEKNLNEEDKLSTVKELNYSLGLERVGGNVKLYRKILFDFIDMFRDSAMEFERLLREDDFEGGIQLSHNIKGSSGNIGAKDIYHASKVLEASFKAQENISSALRSYKETFSSLLDSIDSLKEEKRGSQATKVLISQAQLDKLLGKIEENARKRKVIECQNLSKELERFQWPKEHTKALKSILAALSRYRFEDAIITIKEFS